MKFNTVVCGGTFDHFHKGHSSLLKLAFSLGKKVIIGVTSDQYVKKLKIKNEKLKIIEEFKERKASVLEFVKIEGVLGRTEIVEIGDLFGPTLSKELPIDSIVISQETKKGAEIINQKRKELGLKDLNLFIAPPVLAEDGKLISSERIRNGEINREGKFYVNPLWLKKDLILPENLREEFRKPFGTLIAEIQRSKNLAGIVATVGDVTTKKFNELFLNQHVSAVDFKVGRVKKFSTLKELGFPGSEKVLGVENPAGCLMPALFKACQKVWEEKGRTVILVEGEEDLAVLPLVLTAPLGSTIFYGQPQEGLVKVDVSEVSKTKAYGLVSRFKTRS